MLESSAELPFILMKLVRVNEVVIFFSQNVVFPYTTAGQLAGSGIRYVHGLAGIASQVVAHLESKTGGGILVAIGSGCSITKDRTMI